MSCITTLTSEEKAELEFTITPEYPYEIDMNK